MKSKYAFRNTTAYLRIGIVCMIQFLVFSGIYGQQDLMLTQYSSALQLTNPAYAGTSERLNATAMIRNQWLGFEGAPKSQALLINSPIMRYHLGIGCTLIHDEIGPDKRMTLYTNVAFNFNLTPGIKISMGLSGGININKINYEELTPITLNDPAYSLVNQVQYIPNFGSGIYIYSPSFYLGFSSPKLVKRKYSALTEIPVVGGEVRHYYIIGAYLFKVNEMWNIKPSFSLKMVKGAPLSLDVTANAIYNDKLWFGTMCRIGDALGFIFQYQINENLRIGYSYDLPLTQMMRNSAGSHELTISYDLVFKEKKIVTPRYF